MQPFRDVLDECGFMDMGFVGSLYTWHRHYTNYTVWERLDRVMATNDWFAKLLETKIRHLDVTTSDHKPLWIVPEAMECRQQWPFWFEQMWMTEKGCGKTIEAVWSTGNDEAENVKLIKKIDKCGRELTGWSKKCFGNVRRDLEKKRKLLAKAEKSAQNGGSVDWMKQLEREINSLMYKEAQLWRQR